jgi:nitroreductase
MGAIDAIHTRRSIRDYEDRIIERSLVESIIWDVAQAPRPPVSASEPLIFVVVEGADRVSNCGHNGEQVRYHDQFFKLKS